MRGSGATPSTLTPSQRISHVWAGSGHSGTLLPWATTLAVTVEIVAKMASQVGFHVQPRRWVVDRTLAWRTRCRRTVRDHERLRNATPPSSTGQ